MSLEIEQAATPTRVYLQLPEKNWRRNLRVAKAQQVFKGELLLAGEKPVHASTSGVIEGICLWPSSARDCIKKPHLVILADGKDQWIRLPAKPKTGSAANINAAPEQLLNKIHDAGIVGLGGAAFATDTKLQSGIKHKATKLVLNGVECEPGVSADEALMRAAPQEILKAALVTLKILGLRQCTLAVGAEKIEAIQALKKCIEQMQIEEQVLLILVTESFPSGSERQLIKILFNQDLPRYTYATQAGIVCLNVSTLFAIYQAVFERKALVERVVTLHSLQSTSNLRVHLGTPAQALFTNTTCMDHSKLRRGGPLTGWMQSLDACVEKGTTALELLDNPELPAAQACIRCSRCAEVCPENLLPQELLWYSRSTDQNKLSALHLQACLECGLCESVCPSQISLTNIFRDSKDRIRESQLLKQQALQASKRVAKHQARQEMSVKEADLQRVKRMQRLQKLRPNMPKSS